MSAPTYTEPPVSFLVLDYDRFEAAQSCLKSIRHYCKLPHYQIIYLHNGLLSDRRGLPDYPLLLLQDGLIDQLITPRINGGLGLGTRTLFGACFSPLAIYWQVDQVMGRDFTQDEVDDLMRTLAPDSRVDGSRICMSVSLAGPVCGTDVYSERAGAMLTETYRMLEREVPLGAGGAGPWHHLPWREGAIQQFYREHGYFHHTHWKPLAVDNGRDAARQNPDGSRWRHQPDTKRLWLLGSHPVKERYVYPKLTDAEWARVIETQSWPPGEIPEQERKDSFTVPHWH